MEPTILTRRFYYALQSFPLLAIPLFIMLGILADRAQMLPKLVVWLQMIFGWTRGGMAYINVVAAMLFAGISGTAVSDIASLGRSQIQMMTRVGYPLAYSAALTAATAIIAPIIPPSVAMIIYALAVGNVSVGAMFAGAMIPGVMMGARLHVRCLAHDAQGRYGRIFPAPTAGEFCCRRCKRHPAAHPAGHHRRRHLQRRLHGHRVGGRRVGVHGARGPRAEAAPALKDIYDATLYSAVVSAVAGMLLGAGAIVAWILTYNRVTQISRTCSLVRASAPSATC